MPDNTKVTFIKYIHEHLLARAQDVRRVRHYICPRCGEPVESVRAVFKAVERGLKSIPCQFCSEAVPLFDLIEQKFTSSRALAKVRELDERARINLDNESRELILVGHATAIAEEAGQIFRVLSRSDWGIDGEIEFKNDKGQASGQKIYLQLKTGDSYLHQRDSEDAEEFTIKNQRHAEYWLAQTYPVMLVIRTSDGKIHWMNVTEYLRKHGTATKQIVFKGEPFTALSVVKLRNKLLHKRTVKKGTQEKLIKQAIEHPDPEVRQSSLLRLAKLRPDDITRSLFQRLCINDSDSDVRHTALENLTKIWPDAATRELLVQTATNDDSCSSRSAAVQALTDKWPDNATQDFLLDIARKDSNDEVRAVSCEMLSSRWWNELGIRQWFKNQAKIDSSDYVRQRMMSAIEKDTTRDQLSGLWEAKLSGQRNSDSVPEVLPGYPAFRVSRFRLRDIGPFHDTEEVVLRKDVNVFLGDNAAGKTTILKCLALAAIGATAANEVEEGAAGYLRKGAKRGCIEVLFDLLPDPDSFSAEIGQFVVGLQVTAGSTRFAPIPDSEITLERPGSKAKRLPNSAEYLGALRTKIGSPFGFACGYGATRTFSESRYALQPELEKPENEWVLSLFRPEAWLANSEIFSKLLRGDTSNIKGSPPGGLNVDLTRTLQSQLKHILPKVEAIFNEGKSDLRLNQEDLRFGELSDGYRSMLALVGHLLRCSLRLRNWEHDPTDIQGITLIDEIDLHLHPAWQKHVVQDLRETFPNIQLITSTHSPLVVGALDASSIFLLRNDSIGAKIIALSSILTETDSMKAWRADQILTGPGFNLNTSVSDEGENWEDEYEDLWSVSKNNRRDDQNERLNELGRLLNREIPRPEESPYTREAMNLFEEWTLERLKGRAPEDVARIIREVKQFLEYGDEVDSE